MESSAVKNAVGVWFYSLANDSFLYLMRNDTKHPYNWGLPGGKCEANETLIDTIHRECTEELGSVPQYQKLIPIEKFTSADEGFCYHTFFCAVDHEFIPTLNHEHVGYCWLKNNIWPKPMHPGLWNTINIEYIIDKIETLKQLQISQ
jgi:8-oxo-dGTP pyrophosphatase MutT (NUDIX family)